MKETNSITARYSGILVHPTSFPSPYGIGDLGKGAYDFIDFSKDAGQTLWQCLPLGPTGFGDSPYQSFSSFAGQPLIISPDKTSAKCLTGILNRLIMEPQLHGKQTYSGNPMFISKLLLTKNY